MFGLLNVFALHAVVLSLSVAWQAYIQDAPHLYVTAAIALVLKAIIIPVALHRIVVRLGIHRTIETVVGIGPTMLAGIGLVALSMVVMLQGHGGGRSAGARGPGVRAVGRAARPADDGDAAQRGQPGRRLHVAGERPDPGGHRRQGHAAGGRDQRRLLGAGRLHRHRRVPVPHPRALRLGRRRRRSTSSGESGDERPAGRSAARAADADPGHPGGGGRAAGAAARLLAGGAPQRAGRRCRRLLAALSLLVERPRARRLSVRRRPQRRLRRARAPSSASPPASSAPATSATSWRSAG